MTIITVIDSLNPGGAERVAVNIANELGERGHRSILVATRLLGQLQSEVSADVELLCLNRSSRVDVRAVFRLAQLYRDVDVDLVHAHSSSLYIATAAALLRPSVIVYHEHFGWSERIGDVTPWLLRPLVSTIGGVVAVNDLLCTWMRQKVFGRHAVVTYLRNFTQRRSVISDRESAGDARRIVCMANFRPQKDHHTLIRAVHRLRAFGLAHFDVILLGRYDADDPYFQSVLQEIHEFELGDVIQVMQSTTDVDAVLAGCTIGVLSSRSEGLPLTLLEYAKNGLAVVSTDVGQCSEVLDHGNAGILIPAGDVETLAGSLRLLLDDEGTRTVMAEALTAHVMSYYSAEVVIPRLLSVYHEIMNVSLVGSEDGQNRSSSADIHAAGPSGKEHKRACSASRNW